jgi:bifunctional UDP-N-acetylglucosamine pyrophosphorylase/glucosamine-1-phosphate N-acetyltransferase
MHSDGPKVLQPLAGRPLLQHVLDTACALKAEKTIVVYGHGGNGVRKAINRPGLIWREQTPQLGTGHALKQALPVLNPHAQVLVLYGDMPLISQDTCRRILYRARKNDLTLLTAHLAHPKGYGRIIRDAKGNVVCIVEEKEATPHERSLCETNTGVLAARASLLKNWLGNLKRRNRQGEYYLTDIVEAAVNSGQKVASCQPQNDYEACGVNTREQLAGLESHYRQRMARELMDRGVMLMDPARVDVRGELKCGRDVVIDVGCVFEGRVVLSDRVRIGPYCVLRDMKIASGALVGPFCVMEEAEIGKNCHIGPFSRLRPGTRIQDRAHIGNFVEIKNSCVGRGSKINHLSYVGDSTVGRDVNIGAGTITCNYDGANKHRTVIEDNAFIGSNTQLIAPVKIGRGATIGAGSTITKDAPRNELTLSRTNQVTVKGWKRPTRKR